MNCFAAHSDPAAAGSRKQTIGALITKQTAGSRSLQQLNLHLNFAVSCARPSKWAELATLRERHRHHFRKSAAPLEESVRDMRAARVRADNESANNFVSSTWMRIRSASRDPSTAEWTHGEGAISQTQRTPALLSRSREFCS